MINGVVLKEITRHEDGRGHFAEIFRAADHRVTFVQANHSFTKKHALRGLHYHRHQADLWYVVSGQAQVGLVDLRTRQDPPIVHSLVLDAAKPATLFIPPGVAHGYVALTDLQLVYFVTTAYDASDEYGIPWNGVSIDWLVDNPVLSERDAQAPALDWSQIGSFD